MGVQLVLVNNMGTGHERVSASGDVAGKACKLNTQNSGATHTEV